MPSQKIVGVTVAVIVIAAVLLVSVYSGVFSASPQPPKTLVVAIWGGSASEALKTTIIPAFEKAQNAKVEIVTQRGASDTLARLRNEKDNPTVDIWFTTDSGAYIAMKEGLLSPLDLNSIPSTRDLQEGALMQDSDKTYSIAYGSTYILLAVNTNIYDAAKITSYKDFLWSDQLKAKSLLMPAFFGWSGFPAYYAAKLWGGDEYKIDIGFDKLKQLAPKIGLVTVDQALVQRSIASGDVGAAFFAITDIKRVIVDGAPVKIVVPKNEPIFYFSNFVSAVRKGPAGTDLQNKFIEFVLSTEGNSKFLNFQAYEPMNKKSKIESENLQYTNLPNRWKPDLKETVTKFTEWNRQWESQVQPLLGK